jgi:hypothetical protein
MIDLEETHVFTAHSATRRSHPVALERRRTWRDLRPLLTAFYREGIKYDLDAGGRSTASRIVRERYSLTCPSHVRIRGRFVSAPAALLRMIEGETPMYGWLSHLPIPRYWVRTLLNVDPQRVPHVLAHIAHRSCSFGGPSFKLTAPIIQKALAAVRRANDSSVPAGALVALLGSKFFSFADDELVLAMIKADRDHGDVAYRLFAGGRRADSSPRLLAIATAIVNERIGTSRTTGVAAARYLAENTAVSLPPLTSDGPKGHKA